MAMSRMFTITYKGQGQASIQQFSLLRVVELLEDDLNDTDLDDIIELEVNASHVLEDNDGVTVTRAE